MYTIITQRINEIGLINEVRWTIITICASGTGIGDLDTPDFVHLSEVDCPPRKSLVRFGTRIRVYVTVIS